MSSFFLSTYNYKTCKDAIFILFVSLHASPNRYKNAHHLSFLVYMVVICSAMDMLSVIIGLAFERMIDLNFLAIDTSSSWLKIAVQAGEEIATLNMRYKRRSDFLMIEIDHILKSVNISLDDLDGLGCVIGPGHFTGLRSGLASVKAMAFANSLKISALPYPECLTPKEPLILLRKARKGWWYFSEFDGSKWSYSMQAHEKLKELVEGKRVISEEGIEGLKTEIASPIFTPLEMLKSLEKAFEKGENVYDHLSLKPFYVQRPIAEEKLMEKKRGKV